MRKLFFLLLLLAPLAFCSCEKETEEMKYAAVYFPLATRADTDGVFQAEFKFDRDTTFMVAVYCAGSIMTPVDVDVQLVSAADSLSKLPKLADYELLPEDAYTTNPEDLRLTVKKNTERGEMFVTFLTSRLDPEKKYILPLKIERVSQYEIASKYECLFFGISAAKE